MATFIIWKHQSVFQPIRTTQVFNTPLGKKLSYIAFVYAHKFQYWHSPIVYNIITFSNNKFFQL